MKFLQTIVAISALICVLAVTGCKAGTPSGLEKSVVTESKRNVTIGGTDWKNPAPDTLEAAKEGGKHFQHHCQICHGYADGQLKWIIENGVAPSGMPGWKGILEDDEMWKIVRYIRHLPPKGSLGAPAIYKEEAEEHEHMHEHGKEGKPHTHKHSH